MENAVDALYLAFAVMLLVLALAGAMNLFSLARETSDIVIGTVESSESDVWYLTEEDATSKYREVGLETIIPSLYRYYKENLTIVFLKGTVTRDGNGNVESITHTDPLPIYTTQTLESDWTSYYIGDDTVTPKIFPSYGYRLNGTSHKDICVFDIEEENARVEPFAPNRKANIDAILAGEKVNYTYRGGNAWYDYRGIAGNPLLDTSKKYLEIVKREDTDYLHGNKTTRKTVITYIQI